MEEGVRMKAYCPNKCEEEQFVTTVLVVQEIVTPNGEFVDAIETTEFSDGTNIGNNEWTCHTCGEEAKWNIKQD